VHAGEDTGRHGRVQEEAYSALLISREVENPHCTPDSSSSLPDSLIDIQARKIRRGAPWMFTQKRHVGHSENRSSKNPRLSVKAPMRGCLISSERWKIRICTPDSSSSLPTRYRHPGPNPGAARWMFAEKACGRLGYVSTYKIGSPVREDSFAKLPDS